MSHAFVAYYRVSTQRQGVSGLGLEAQRKAVSDYLAGNAPLAEFTEIESGRKKNRPQLIAALALAKKQKATLVIAKMDRLARNVSFIANLIETNVKFVAVDMPEADRSFLQMAAVFAEWEGRKISERTKAALAAAKARGTVLGTNGTALAVRHRAEAHAYVSSIADAVSNLRRQHPTVRRLTVALNAAGPGSIAGVFIADCPSGFPASRPGAYRGASLSG